MSEHDAEQQAPTPAPTTSAEPAVAAPIVTPRVRTLIPRQASRRRPRRKLNNLLRDPDTVIDYKNPQLLRNFLTERGKLIPRRLTGATAREQRKLAKAIKRARMIALLPFSVTGRD